MESERAEDLLLSLPRALRLLRESRGLGQDDLDRLTAERNEKVGRASIARYEGGKRAPSLESLRRLLGALEVTWDEFGRALAAARRGDTANFPNMSRDSSSASAVLSGEGPTMKLVVELGQAAPESVAEVLRRVLDKDGAESVARSVQRAEAPKRSSKGRH